MGFVFETAGLFAAIFVLTAVAVVAALACGPD